MRGDLKYIPNEGSSLFPIPDAHQELLHTLSSLIRECPPVVPWKDGFKDAPRGLWTGPTSIAYLWLWLSRMQEKLIIEGKTTLEWCNAYLDCGQKDFALDHKECGIKNEYLAYSAVAACATQNTEFVDRLLKGIGDVHTQDDYNEYLSGRAGTLFLLRLVRSFVSLSADATTRAMVPLIEHILQNKPWQFNDVPYLGAAHGSIGIITQIVLSDPSYAPKLEENLINHLDLQKPNGHWLIRLKPDEEELVQFCHGAPGFVISLVALRQYFPNLLDRIDAAIELGRRDIWERGLLKKEPNLCHGITGNALALQTPQERNQFMAHATHERIEAGIANGTFVKGTDPWGLGWGGAGRAWGWMVMLQDEKQFSPMFAAYTDV